MKATLRYRYVRLPHINDPLNAAPMGTIARRYRRPVILMFLRPSSIVVVRAMIWVMIVAKSKCHVVRMIG